MLSKGLQHFSEFYTANLLRRIIIGIITGILVYFFIIILTLILDRILTDSAFNNSLLHDIPLIGFITSLVVSLEVFGLIPHPQREIAKEKLNIEEEEGIK